MEEARFVTFFNASDANQANGDINSLKMEFEKYLSAKLDSDACYLTLDQLLREECFRLWLSVLRLQRLESKGSDDSIDMSVPGKASFSEAQVKNVEELKARSFVFHCKMLISPNCMQDSICSLQEELADLKIERVRLKRISSVSLERGFFFQGSNGNCG